MIIIGTLAILITLYYNIVKRDYPLIVINILALLLIANIGTIGDVELHILWYVAWINLLPHYTIWHILVNMCWIVSMVLLVI